MIFSAQSGQCTVIKRKKMTWLPMIGLIADLVEHRTGIAEVKGSNPVETLNSSVPSCLR